MIKKGNFREETTSTSSIFHIKATILYAVYIVYIILYSKLHFKFMFSFTHSYWKFALIALIRDQQHTISRLTSFQTIFTFVLNTGFIFCLLYSCDAIAENVPFCEYESFHGNYRKNRFAILWSQKFSFYYVRVGSPSRIVVKYYNLRISCHP